MCNCENCKDCLCRVFVALWSQSLGWGIYAAASIGDSDSCDLGPALNVWCIISPILTVGGCIAFVCLWKGLTEWVAACFSVYIGWVLSGSIWTLSAIANYGECDNWITAISVLYLCLCWTNVIYIAFVFKKTPGQTYGNYFKGKSNIKLLTAQTIVLWIVMFFPNFPYTECKLQPLLTIWTTVNGFTPVFFMLFLLGMRSGRILLKILSSLCYLIYLTCFIAGSVATFQVYFSPDRSCSARIRGFSVFSFTMSLVLVVMSAYISAYVLAPLAYHAVTFDNRKWNLYRFKVARKPLSIFWPYNPPNSRAKEFNEIMTISGLGMAGTSNALHHIISDEVTHL